MTMVTHKTLLQPLRLHYIIESNAGREGGREEEKRREGKRKYRIGIAELSFLVFLSSGVSGPC